MDKIVESRYTLRHFFNKWKQLTLSRRGSKCVLSDKVYAAAKASARRRLYYSRLLKYKKALKKLAYIYIYLFFNKTNK